MTLNAVCATEQAQVGLDQLTVAGFEVDDAPPSDETSVGRG
jgi:hypothetical protein